MHLPPPQLEAEAYSLWMAGSLLLEKESDWEGALARFLKARCASNTQGEGGCGGLEDGGKRELEGLECLLPAPVGTLWSLFAGQGGHLALSGNQGFARLQRNQTTGLLGSNRVPCLTALPSPQRGDVLALSCCHAPPPPPARRKLFEELSKVGSFEQQAVCKHFLDQVEPTIR